tara:strand:+ start:17814 stop:18389 length:576 start_codon:yes stop_codon:yes gene_type:complete
MTQDQFYKRLALGFFQYKEKTMSLFKKRLAHRSVSQPDRFQNINSLENRLWQRFEVEQEDLREKKVAVGIVGFCEPNLIAVENLLHEIGVHKVTPFKGITQLYESINRPCNMKKYQREFSHVIVNLDSFPSLECGIDSLLDFRKVLKSTRIILTSTYAVRNDFGDEKASICDATLSLPLSSTTLNIAINSR